MRAACARRARRGKHRSAPAPRGSSASWPMAVTRGTSSLRNRRCMRCPPAMPASEAAVMHCTFGTAYRDVKTLGKIVAGERVLITGANGGVGMAAVQIAARLGREVVCVVRSAAHVELFVAARRAPRGRRCGHDVPRAAAATGHRSRDRSGGAVDVRVVVANAPPRRAHGGRRQHRRRAGGAQPRRAHHAGAFASSAEAARPAADMAELLALHEAKPFTVAIDRVLPLSQADAAQRLVRAGGLKGRIVLVPSG